MTALLWNETGTRFYEVGVDRGVLYLPDGSAIPWNGLISVDEKLSGGESTSLYFDGTKYADVLVVGDFSATLKAYTFPDEFLQFEGVLEAGSGLLITNQPQSKFGLSYRTKVGNDVAGQDLGYKIHLLYNLTATPSDKSFLTISDQPTAIEFEWTITAIPGEIPGFKPTAHVIFDTRFMTQGEVQSLETILYGDVSHTAYFPPLSTIKSLL